MAQYHIATLTPTKAELLTDWVRSQPWGPTTGEPVELIGAYRFDDPEGQVGMESHLVTSGGQLFHVPLTYRGAPLEGADDALVVEMHHSVLGQRWVYDGLRDPSLVTMLAAVTLTGQGEALGMVTVEGRTQMVPSAVRVHGGGWTGGRATVDGFECAQSDAAEVVLRNGRFDLTVFRRPVPADRPPIALTATWAAQPAGVVLATIVAH